MTIKFNKHNVANQKARVQYSVGNRTDGREAVTLYAKDYDRALHAMFATAQNNSDALYNDAVR